ncbi:DUF4139 domain-containing protein [Polaribacter sp. Hel1_85]|uniref:DUF4139 domain-containing protein n=1 Tax=Polaribacter sp. Hel1_85 TaxID=1250005 RepID=UPI00052DFE63|nr:DUF4139 domain-containing protein [Polaribacter sp. Hel1_85]KGL61863.1 hypothetical protein PHEL85_1648 [Polaribacter sp. Hel1_85]
MKKIAFIIFVILLTFTIQSQEKELKSIVNSATVFLNSAQVTRNKNVQLEKGTQVLKFVDLSPFIDKKSIQIQAKDLEIQAVSFQKNYIKESKKSSEQLLLENKLEVINNSINLENISLETAQEEIEFLKSNRSIKGNQTITVAALRETSKFYSSQIKASKTKELKIKNKRQKLLNEKTTVTKQLNDLTGKKRYASGEISIKVKSNTIKKVNLKLTYNISNVSWFPSYDVRVSDINSPLTLVYKANLKQNSKVDWKNVKLRFSSANPSNSTKAGKIIPYFLNYGSRPPYYGGTIDEVTGYVTDGNEPLPGANVIVKGTTIGTSTDFEGKYSIKIPENSKQLEFSYLGYKPMIKRITTNTINAIMQEDNTSLDEIVVVGYGRTKKKTIKSAKAKEYRMAVSKVSAVPTQEIIDQTSFSFEIIEPYTVKSSNKDFVVTMKVFNSNANYTYYSVPKIEENAFLLASISNWEQFNLLEGEANIYFENTFIGSSLIDPRTIKNSLPISLGMDKNVSVKRIKSKKFTTKQFISTKKEETRAWDIIIKNNKTQNIKIIVLDQIPISSNEEIKVTLGELFNGKLNKNNGEVKWEFILPSKAVKNIKLKYTVKYPKNRNLIID